MRYCNSLNKSYEGLQDSWSYLIFNLLNLQPSKASMLSSSAYLEQDNNEGCLEKQADHTTGATTSEQEDTYDLQKLSTL
jgi:hypothetical protein